MSKPLTGTVALVAGATRGAGRGISVALGEMGATVYCSGRSSRTGDRPEIGLVATKEFAVEKRPETIEETAELVTAAGGKGVAAVCDHSDPEQVAALVNRIRAEQGKLDVLVNNVWGGDSLVQWNTPFWDQDISLTFRLWDRAIRTHVVTARAATPLMLESGGRLIVEVTDGSRLNYRGDIGYDVAKTTVIRMAFAMAEDLRAKNVAAVAVTPGFLRSEAMLEYFGVTEADWKRGAEKDPNFAFSESPRFVGRGVAALAADPDIMRKSGTVTSSWELARGYGFTDVDGTRPDWGAHTAGEDFGAGERASHDRFVSQFSEK